MDVVYSIVGKVVEYIISPVERRVRYHFHYRKNIKNLEEQLQILVDARGRVQNMVDDARSNAYNIEDDVLMWLIKVDEIMSQENERKSLEKKCLNMFRQHKLSREAKKKVEVVSKILEKRTNFDKVGYPAPLSRIECSIGDDYQILESRTLIAKKIRDALADDNVNKVGIYGMGGVGKTMLLKEIKRSVKESKLFDHVITVTVSQTWDVKGIQSQIGDILRLRLNEVESKQARAVLLRNKLEKGNKILIVLDDVWKELNLEDVGIPCRSKLGEKGCKILITSRDQDVLANEMNTKEYFQVKPLNREESWKFFKNMIGEIDKICIEPIAKDVAKKCAGLPIALTTVAKALKGKNLPIWKDALKQLENPIAVNIKGVSDMVYSSLQLSYDYIKGEEAKFLFLISSVFPYDYKIPLKDLQMYAMGMELLIDVNTWEEARNRTIKLVCDLKSSSLLEEFISRNMMLSTKNYVKMHDVIRDVAKYIASKEVNMSTLSYGYGLSEWREKDKCGNYKAIFVDCHGFHNFPHHLKFTKLELLILCGHRREQKLQIFDTIFEGMEKLKVLDLSGMHFPQLTTSLIHSLANLRTLCMSNCKFDDTRIIGELKKLEILKISECPIIELSATMNQLTELKVLSVSKCSLKVIPPNIISSMKKLEELDLWSSFNGWGAEVLYQNKLNKNASLSELNCLPHLTILKLHILDENNLPHLSLTKDLKLERIHIGVGDMNWTRKYRYEATMRWMWLKSDQSETVLNDQVILQACEEVGLEAKKGITNFIFKSNETSYTNLRHLFLGKNSDMQYLIGDHQLESCSFPSLESLSLFEMKSLENIAHMHVRANPFNKLKFINTSNCKQLRTLFSFSVFKAFQVLQEILISNCNMMDGIVSMETEGANVMTEYTHLSFLQLHSVHKITSFCAQQLTYQQPQHNIISFFDDQVVFPELKDLKIHGANNLKMLWRTNRLVTNSFCKLESISIKNCDSLRYIFPSNMVPILVSLNVLNVGRCKLLEGIFEKEKPTLMQKDHAKVLPLLELNLDDLPNLKYVWNNDAVESLTFPNLEKVSISNCPQLKTLFPTSIKYFQQLESLSMHGVDEMFYEDKASKLVFSNEIVSFPSLRNLSLACKAVERSFWVRLKSFPKLSSLTLIGCKDDDMITLPQEMNQILYCIEELQVRDAFQLVQIFSNEEENNHNIQRFANLKKLILCNLPNLTHVWKWKEDNTQMSILFDNLERLDAMGCGTLKCLMPSSIRFFNLKSLNVSECHGMISLLSPSVAKSLEKLENITIHHCREMTSILAQGEGLEEQKGEIIFTNLVELKVDNLPRLESFHLGKFMLRFPCLSDLIITQCPEMKIFSHGIISTPKLPYVQTNAQKIWWENDSLVTKH